MRFSREMVTEVEMHLWRTAITQVVAAGPARNRLGTFVAEGHKIWDWRIQEEAGRLYRRNGDTVQVMGHVRRGRYDTPWQSRTGQMRGDYATVEDFGRVSGRCARLPPFPPDLFHRRPFWMSCGDGVTPGSGTI